MSTNIKHSSETNEHYTPDHILEAVRKVFGGIDLDPATSVLANQRVQATKIFTAEDGEETLRADWKGRVFLNPPGGRKLVIPDTGHFSNPALFWSKLMFEWKAENTWAAIVVGFTIEVLQTSQRELEYPMLRFPFCVPRERIDFNVPRQEKLRQLRVRYEKKPSELLKRKLAELEVSSEEVVSGDQPPHGNVVVLVPPKGEHFSGVGSDDRPWVTWQGPVTSLFQDVFAELGYVRI